MPASSSRSTRLARPAQRLRTCVGHRRRHMLCLGEWRAERAKSTGTVTSHVQALSLCRNLLKKQQSAPLLPADTAGAASEIAEMGDKSVGGIASSLAARIY